MRYRRFGEVVVRESVKLVLITLVALTGSANAQKLAIREVIWGFDGKVTPNEFSPVSILIDNPNEVAYEGDIALRQRSGTGQSVGARFVERDLYIAPLADRWVQFYPYHGTSPENSSWQLSWQRGSTMLPQVKEGQHGLVMLVSSEGLSSGARGIRTMNEDVFPPGVSATHGLKTVILDHEPRWQQPRRQAFLDWLRLGGQLHIVAEDEGEYPSFTKELSVLNSPQLRQRVGSGTVFRHKSPKLDSKFPEKLRALELRAREQTAQDTEELLDEVEQLRARAQEGYYGSLQYGWNAAERAHSSLIQITRPDHNWPLIYLLAIVYVLLIFPGCYLLGRRKSHYLYTYGAILGAATLFSLCFLYVGRRGYGEQTAVNAVGIAQRLDGDRWDVMQWSNVFVTRGDTYQLEHTGDGAIYAVGQQTDSVRGSIEKSQRDKRATTRTFEVDIPPFSSRPYVHRQVVTLPNLSAKLDAIDAGEELRSLSISVGAEFPTPSGNLEVTIADNGGGLYYEDSTTGVALPALRAVYRDSVYSLKPAGPGKFTLGSRLGKLSQYVDISSLTNFDGSLGFFYDRGEISVQDRYRKMFHAMMAHHFGIFRDVDFKTARLPGDCIRLLCYTKMPSEMFLGNETLANQQGYVLLAQDLPIETTP